LAPANAAVALRLDAGERGGKVRPRIGEHAALEARAHDRFEDDAGHHKVLVAAKELAVDAVADHQPILLVPHHEAFGCGLDGSLQAGLSLGQRLGQLLASGDVSGRADEPDGAAAGIAHGKPVLTRPAPRAVARLVAHLALKARAEAAEVVAAGGLVAWPVLGM